MALSPAQLQTLRTAIDADVELSAYPLSTDGYIDLRDKLNLELASPTFYVWRESISIEEIQSNGFEWVEVDSLTVGKARIWEWMRDNGANGIINPSKLNVRKGIEECWKGTAQRLAVQAAVFALCRKAATRVAKIFATTSVAPPAISGDLGSATNVATAVVVGVTAADVEAARNLP